jgi:hypothetical protein
MATEQIIKDFEDNAIKSAREGQQEMFIHNYNPTYIGLDVAVAFVLIDQEFQFIVTKQDIGTLTIYESAEMNEPTITNFRLRSSDGTTNSSILNFSLPEPETERINYAKPVEFQISLEEEAATAQRDYINSIPRREIEFNTLSSLGPITSEGIVLDNTTTGAESQLTSATEAITDVGGPTATIGGY